MDRELKLFFDSMRTKKQNMNFEQVFDSQSDIVLVFDDKVEAKENKVRSGIQKDEMINDLQAIHENDKSTN